MGKLGYFEWGNKKYDYVMDNSESLNCAIQMLAKDTKLLWEPTVDSDNHAVYLTSNTNDVIVASMIRMSISQFRQIHCASDEDSAANYLTGIQVVFPGLYQSVYAIYYQTYQHYGSVEANNCVKRWLESRGIYDDSLKAMDVFGR